MACFFSDIDFECESQLVGQSGRANVCRIEMREESNARLIAIESSNRERERDEE